LDWEEIMEIVLLALPADEVFFVAFDEDIVRL